MTSSPPAVLRDAALADAPAVTEFLRGLGLVMPQGQAAIERHWKSLWRDNPSLPAHGPNPALGWILESEGRVVGFFGNVPQVSYFGERPVRVSSARAWAVDPKFRAETPRLCQAFFGQKDIDLLLISSASAPAGKRCLEFGGARLPLPDYDKILYWPIDAFGFLKAGLRKQGRGAALAWLLALIGALGLNAEMRLMGRRPFAPLDGIEIKRLDEIDEGFDDLWRRKLAEYPGRLLARRDAVTLRWYFGIGAGASETRVVVCRRQGRVLGYAVLVREDAPAIGLKRIKLADMLVEGDDAGVVRALMTAAYEYGLAKRCHVLEAVGLAPELRAVLTAMKPYRRAMPTFPFFYKALRPDLVEALAKGDGWYVTAYDGDTALL